MKSTWKPYVFVLAGVCLMNATAALGIELGGKPVAKEKFLVFIFFGDSNTFGARARESNQDSWRSNRYWHLGPSGAWEPGQSATVTSFKRAPGSRGGFKGDPGSGVSYPTLKLLVERYPEYHFGSILWAPAGGDFGGAFPAGFELIQPYLGQFTLGGLFVDGGSSANFLQRVCLAFKTDIKSVPVVSGQLRVNSWNNGEVRATPEWGGDGKGLLNAMAGIETIMKSLPMGAIVSTEGLRIADNRHNMYPGGNEVYGTRAALKFVAMGWVPLGKGTPDREKPTTPKNVRAEKVWDQGVTLVWEAAQDNLAVEGYEVFCDGEKVPWWPGLSPKMDLVTTVATRFPVSELKPGSEHVFSVRAMDYARNASEMSPPVKARLLTSPVRAKLPLKINVGGEAVGDWVADKEFRDGGDYGYLNSPGSISEKSDPADVAALFPDKNAPEIKVFSTRRASQAVYKVRVPDGEYRVTWYMQGKETKGKIEDPFAVKMAKFCSVFVFTVKAQDGKLILGLPGGIGDGRGGRGFFALTVDGG